MSHYHFIAIGGTGMSGIAKILLETGHSISGSDIKSSDTTRRLSDMGASVVIGHAASNLPQSAEVVVVSSAIHDDNPEVVEAIRRGIPVLHRSDMLAMLLNEGKGIAVAGAHGKTTTTSMISVILEKAGLDPTVLIGGDVSDFGGNAKLGHGGFIVAEADESDGSFLKLRPYIGVITNIDADHLDYYGDLANVKAAFRRFAHERVKDDGYLVYCSDDAEASEVASEKSQRAVSYGLGSTARVSAGNLTREQWGSSFDLVIDGENRGRAQLRVPGLHNVLDALGAIAVAHLLSVDMDDVIRGLGSFGGAQRRLQMIGVEHGVLVLDDYAHHPTEVRASLKAVRDQVGGRVLCIYQPHRYSRTLALKDDFGRAFVDCDQLYLADIYAGPGEQAIDGVGSSIIADAVERQTGAHVVHLNSWDAIVDRVVESSRSGDAIVTMGAGDIYTMGATILNRLGHR